MNNDEYRQSVAIENGEVVHPLQQCLSDNGEKIAAAVTEAQFREVLAVNTELRGEAEKLKADCRNYLHEVEQLKARIVWLECEAKAHDVEASVPTFPCEFCGVFHSYSEVAEAGGYCPQCEADYDERKMLADLLARYAALTAAPHPVAQDGWIPVSERLPEGTVLVSYTNNYNKSRIIRAKYVQKFTQESEDIDDFDAQYDEETDTYYDCEGWYEMIDNWGDYSSVAVTEGTVTHWMPLPSAPKGGE